MKTLLIAFSCFISVSVFSQNITNTLGTGGVFTIQDVSSDYLTLSQSTGEVNILRSLRLENTTSSSLGILFKGTNRFLHNYRDSNTFLGINSGNFTMTGNSNTAVGLTSLYSNTTGSYNTVVGLSSLYSNTSGSFNTALGVGSLYSNSAGSNNTALGVNSLPNNTTGGFNSALGENSLLSNTSGFQNTAIGRNSLLSNSTGSNNTALGYTTGSTITTGTNLTLIGSNAQPTSGSAVNQITLGNSSVGSLRCNVQTITSLSDVRDKKNITDLSLGLDFLMKVKPRLFNWDKREWYENNIPDGSKMKEAPTAGFIAQELDEVQSTENAEWLNLVLKDNPEKLEATYGNLLPVMVKAIQELKVESEKFKVACLTAMQENEKLKVECIELNNKNEILSTEVETLKSMSEKFVKLEQLVNELSSFKHTTLSNKNQNIIISRKGEQK